MPYVEGELCLVKATTPAGHDGHGCQGKCGGRLHRVCGRVAEDNELHRTCSKCTAKAGKRKAIAPEGAGTGQSKRQKTKEGKRLTTDHKVEILDLLEQRLSQEQELCLVFCIWHFCRGRFFFSFSLHGRRAKGGVWFIFLLHSFR